MPQVVPALFAKTPEASAAYGALINFVGELGQFTLEEKKTSLHIVVGKGAFLGVHPRKNGLRLNIVLSRGLEGARIAKSERVSANRYHNEIDFSFGAPMDDQLMDWIREARDRSMG